MRARSPIASIRCALLLAAWLASAAGAERLVAVGDTGALREPFSTAIADGALYVSEDAGMRVQRLQDGTWRRVVGTGAKGDAGVGGPGAQAALNRPHHLLALPGGDLLIADTFNCRVLRFAPASGLVTAFAGTGRKGFAGDGGPAAAAQFGETYCLALAPDGRRVYLADLDNRRIRAIDLATGMVATVAGNGAKGVPADGAKAVEAPLVDPRAVAADAQGRIYVLERNGHCLRAIEPDGTIRTVAGTGKAGNDDGDALHATFNGPKHLCVDRDGSVLIADTENHVVRRYLPGEHRVVRVAGTGKAGAGEPGEPLGTALDRPHGVFVAADGALYIADSGNHRVLELVH
jgi:DNA-binding beta-propeller fold protein YncE